jgi:hypothetical protein
LAYDTLVDERDRLRAQNDNLLEHLKRMDRVEHGVSELPVERKAPLEPMPQMLRDYIQSFASPSIQKEMRDQSFKRHARGEPWASILADVLPAEERSDA